jgi:2Fe-2S ferredoxin
MQDGKEGRNPMSETNGKAIPPEKLVRVTFLPEGKTVEFEFGAMPYQHHGKPMSFLDVAENNDIFLDHACGGVCACTTCHLWIKDQTGISEADDDETWRPISNWNPAWDARP